jgi:hypothetical protein
VVAAFVVYKQTSKRVGGELWEQLLRSFENRLGTVFDCFRGRPVLRSVHRMYGSVQITLVDDLEKLEFPDPDDRELEVPDWLTPDMQLIGRSVYGAETTPVRLWLGLSIYWSPAPRFRPYAMIGKPFIPEHVGTGLPLNFYSSWSDVRARALGDAARRS